MKYCICGEELDFEFIQTNDIGFDHHSYLGKINNKKYRLCRKCLSISRIDNNILNPFKNKYLYSAKTCTTATKRISRISDFISQIAKDNIQNICDFGGADGQLLKTLSKRYKKTSLTAIELVAKDEFKDGINYINSLTKAANSKKIDILIASNSLLYTDYREFSSILQNDNSKPSYVFLSGPNFLKRSAQLFYDDVIYNASVLGIRIFLEKNGYKVIEANYQYISENEYLIAGILNQKENSDEVKTSKNKKNYNLLEQKEKVLNSYAKQAHKINKESFATILGTSIDSAILSSFLTTKFQFTKSKLKNEEVFIKKNVISINKVKSKIFIPILMDKRNSIIKNLKEENISLIIED